MKSRVKGDFHARFCGKAGVKFPCLTRLAVSCSLMYKFFLYFGILFLTVTTIYYFYPEKRLPSNKTIDEIIVLKSKEEMYVYSKGELIKKYTISIGLNPKGDKEYQGDNKTPEGIYSINDKKLMSTCYKNLGISYPNNEDKEYARKLGKPVGGDIKIHGIKNGFGFVNKFHRFKNWTNGCIAVTNDEMEELYNSVKIGAKITIKP